MNRRPPQINRSFYNNNNPEEFSQFYDEVFPRVFAYVAYRVGRKQDAEDIVAQTFLKAVENYQKFEHRHSGSLQAWIFKIAQNLIKNHYRSNGRTQIALSIDEIPDLQDDQNNIDDTVGDRETFLALYQLFANLSPRQAEVIRLKFFGGFRNQEIAETLGLDERTVAAYFSRGLKALGDSYENYINQTMEVRQDE